MSSADAAAAARIAQLDAAVNARITQVRGSVADAIAQADEAARARIVPIDEAAERRLGSLDVIASKASLNLQITLLQVGALLGMVAFLVFALRHLFGHVPKALVSAREQHPAWGRARRGALVSASSAGWVLLHLAAGALGVGWKSLCRLRAVGAKNAAGRLIAFRRRSTISIYRFAERSRLQSREHRAGRSQR